MEASLCLPPSPKMEHALSEVCEWLHLNIGKGRYSIGFAYELARHQIERHYDVHNIYREIAILEGKGHASSVTKPATPFERAPLAGLWHKHHFQARFIARNLLDEARRKDVVEKILAPHSGQLIGEVAGQIAHDLVMGGFRSKAAEHRLTGEFIVYEQSPDGSNYYFTLGSHGEWEAIRARVDDYRQMDAELDRSREL